jgi:AcrR family transcriptional regulator
MRVKTESRRLAIMDAAEKIFGEKGFDLTSMDDIALQVGGSKATLYGYFSSKEELFIEVMRRFGREFMAHLYKGLDPAADIAVTLGSFGEQFLGFIYQPKVLSVQRLVIAQSARAEVGKDFYLMGPLQSIRQLTHYLQCCMSLQKLRQDDAAIAAQQLLGLLQSEHRDPLMFAAVEMAALPDFSCVARRAVAVFLRAYAP